MCKGASATAIYRDDKRTRRVPGAQKRDAVLTAQAAGDSKFGGKGHLTTALEQVLRQRQQPITTTAATKTATKATTATTATAATKAMTALSAAATATATAH